MNNTSLKPIDIFILAHKHFNCAGSVSTMLKQFNTWRFHNISEETLFVELPNGDVSKIKASENKTFHNTGTLF